MKNYMYNNVLYLYRIINFNQNHTRFIIWRNHLAIA